ncbi:MAG: NAD(P)H-hydrate dehydratase [Bacteroidia bacterium]|nr:NAD(P)H-hydrate dehydratase [Bacteroidia bacterium]
MHILNKEQLKFVDEFTIQHEPISSILLMERAARACVIKILKFINENTAIFVFCGKGNNGGDGLAITRMLLERGYNAKACLINYTDVFSNDCKENYDRLKEIPNSIIEINSEDDLKQLNLSANPIAIDAIFGSGLNKPLSELTAETAKFINFYFKEVISIDCPSGLFIDIPNAKDDTIVNSTITFTFQFPKLSFLLAQNAPYVPYFEIIDIGLHPDAIKNISTKFNYITKDLVRKLITKRTKFSHKGTYGHALILAGKNTMRGAALLSAKACLKSGAGKLTVHSVANVASTLISQLPEAMLSIDANTFHITELPNLDAFDAVAIGPGLGTEEETQTVLKKLLNYNSATLVIDADALNILSENKTWLSFLPPETILTPHPSEFDRLTEKHSNDFERLASAMQFALKNRCILILKGAHTAICFPDGTVYFNSSGNPGMAKGGSGDVLTGILCGLLARGYSPAKASIIGVFVHGFAADLILKKSSIESILASEIINTLGKAFLKLEK